MNSDKIVVESLAELKREIPHLNPVGYSSRNLVKRVTIFNKCKLTQ